jgi:ABC-type uncharacterized transport system permease subunit
MNIIALSGLAISLYLITAFLLARRLIKGAAAVDSNKLAYIALGSGAVILHANGLYHHIFLPAGINLGFFNAISLIAMLVAAVVLLSSLRQPIENLGIVVLPIAAVAILMDNVFVSHHILSKRLADEIEVHIILSVLAYSLLSLAAVQAVLIAIQDRRLRHKHPGGILRALPPLQVMENLLFQIITLGFFLLSMALVTGFIYLEDIFAQHLVHKTVLSFIAWVIFAILLWGRWHAGWRGRTAIRWTITGFIVLLLAYFGSKLVLELILSK